MTVKIEARSNGRAPSAPDPRHDATGAAPPIPPAPVLAQPKRRRRPAMLVAGVLLVVVGAIVAYSLATASNRRSSVVALASNIAWGQTISAADLVEAQIVSDPVLRSVAWTERNQLIGQVAASDLHAGGLVTFADVTGELIPADGQALIGVAVKIGQLPATAVRPGQQVLVTHTASKQLGGEAGETAIAARVYTVGEADAAGGRTVDVLVDETDAETVAMWSATGSASIVVIAGR